ncbi:MAG TPA: VWA domain-containing protein [Ktedonobacteraceae bacterium]|jgi:hypothetical protein
MNMQSHNDNIDDSSFGIIYAERLLQRLTAFGHLLREVGVNVGPHQLQDLAETLNYIDLANRDDFYNTLKCSLLTRHEQEPIFNQVFTYFWLQSDIPDQKTNARANKSKRPSGNWLRLPPSERKNSTEHFNINDQRKHLRGKKIEIKRPLLNYDEDEQEQEEGEPQGTAYSAVERLRKKDFEQFSWEEEQKAKRLMAEMRWKVGLRSTRRKIPACHGSYPDMRHMLRRNLKQGAEMIELTWRKIKRKPRPLVIICDISGSMSLYSRLLLHFIHAISNGRLRVEAFVFGTRLTRITHQLEKHNVDEAIKDVSKTVQDWSGGTRIGDALHHFNYTWGRRVLGRGAVVLIISDGWDRGDGMILRSEMNRLQHSCHRLIWLNPLLGSPDYRPLTIGMKTALPFIDDFLPAHNLNSLISLGRLLSSIDDNRPVRR